MKKTSEVHELTKQDMIDQGLNLDVELPEEDPWAIDDTVDWLDGAVCNPDAPEECESCT